MESPVNIEEYLTAAQAILAVFNQQQFRAAEEKALALTLAFPNMGFGWKALGLSIQKQGRSAEAVQPMQHSVGLLPDDAEAHTNLGIALFDLARLDEAQNHLCRALELDFNCISANYGLGILRQRQGQLPNAIILMRRAIEMQLLQPQKPPIQQHYVDFDTQQNEVLMWQTLAQLAAAGVHAFATSGTLLGLQREGHLLSFDKDIDFGLPFAEHATACACLLAHGWQKSDANGLFNPISYQHPATGLSLDLFGFRVEPDTGITIGGFWLENAPMGWSRVTEHPSIKLSHIEGPHGPVWALADPHAWLEVIYGDWGTPDPDFDTVIAAKNLRGFSLLTQFYAFNRILVCWQKGAIHKALSITGHALRHLPDDPLLQQLQVYFQEILLPK